MLVANNPLGIRDVRFRLGAAPSEGDESVAGEIEHEHDTDREGCGDQVLQVQFVDAVAEDTVVTEPAAADASGARAGNDPRVNAAPVQDLQVNTAYPALFGSEVAPPVAQLGERPPRAANDPRGPLAAGDTESADSASA